MGTEIYKGIRNILIGIAFLGFVLGSAITYKVMYKKPPNSQHYKAKKYIKHISLARMKRYTVTHITLTCYQPIKSQCDNDPLTTSDGSKINLNHLKQNKIKWCAISQDLLYLFPKNKSKRIWVDGYGMYEVKDVMNKRHKHRVDLLIHPSNSKMIKLDDVKIKIYK